MESQEGVPWHSPNKTGWKHVQTYGSVDERNVLDDGHSCLCLFQLIGLKWIPIAYKKCLIFILPVHPEQSVKPHAGVANFAFILELGMGKTVRDSENL
jgi:hypothetical protein